MLRYMLVVAGVLLVGQGVMASELLWDWLPFEPGQRWEMLRTDYEWTGDGLWAAVGSQEMDWRVETTDVAVDDDVFTHVLLMGDQTQVNDGVFFVKNRFNGLELAAIGNPNGDGQYWYYWDHNRLQFLEYLQYAESGIIVSLDTYFDGMWPMSCSSICPGLYFMDGWSNGYAAAMGVETLDTYTGELETWKVEILQLVNYTNGYGIDLAAGWITYDVWLAEGIGPVRVEIEHKIDTFNVCDEETYHDRYYVTYELVPEPGMLAMIGAGGVVLLRRRVGCAV